MTFAAEAGAFDCVIVGGGAAGAILVNRCSEGGRHCLCLLEAGPRDWHPWVHVPAAPTLMSALSVW